MTFHYNTPGSGCSTDMPTTCPGQDKVSRHDLVGTQIYNMPGQNPVLRHALVRTQFYGTLWSQRSFTICPSLDTVSQHALVRMHFYDMPCWLRKDNNTILIFTLDHYEKGKNITVFTYYLNFLNDVVNILNK